MRAALGGASMSRMNFAAARRFSGSFAKTTQIQPPVPVGAGPFAIAAESARRPTWRTLPAASRPSARGSASCRRGTSRRHRQSPRPRVACSRCWRAPRAATRRSGRSLAETTARGRGDRDAAAGRRRVGRRRRRARRPAPRTSAGDRRPSLPSGRRCRDNRRSCALARCGWRWRCSSSQVCGGSGTRSLR